MADKRPRKVTIAEVAELAGVSTATVGRVLGDYGYASEDIRQKVQRSAKRLGYRPNQLARSLITGKTKTIGVVAGDIQSPFYSSIMRGISDEARAAGFGVIVTNSDEIITRELEATRLLFEKRVDGLIVAPCDMENSPHLRRAVKDGLPIVQIDRIVRGLDAASVTVDNREAACRAVASLIATGHRRIGILAELVDHNRANIQDLIKDLKRGVVDVRAMFPSWPRFLGYVDAHDEAGLSIDFDLVARVGTYSLEQAESAVRSLLLQPKRPTALFTADGLMSASAVRVVSELMISIPQDLSLIGFDDLDWMAFHKPGITAVVQPLTEIGQQAARIMLESLDSGKIPRKQIVLEASLLHRNSVAQLAI